MDPSDHRRLLRVQRMRLHLKAILHRRLRHHRTKAEIEKQPSKISSLGYSSGSEVFLFRRDFACVPRGLESSLGRVPQAPRLSHALRLDSAVLARICLRAQPLESSLGRVPQAADFTCNKISQPGSFGRRGLSEPREDFSRLTTYAWTQKWFVQILAAE